MEKVKLRCKDFWRNSKDLASKTGHVWNVTLLGKGLSLWGTRHDLAVKKLYGLSPRPVGVINRAG